MRKLINKIVRAFWEITKGLFYGFTYFLKSNLRYFASLMQIFLPYLMYFLGQRLALIRGNLGIGSEILCPIVVTIFIFYIREIADRNKVGNHIPVPNKRFTEVDEYGEVTIENNRLQELILYTADLEDWMHRKGWL